MIARTHGTPGISVPAFWDFQKSGLDDEYRDRGTKRDRMKSVTEDVPVRYEPFRRRSSLLRPPEPFDFGFNRRTVIVLRLR